MLPETAADVETVARASVTDKVSHFEVSVELAIDTMNSELQKNEGSIHSCNIDER